MNKGTRVMLHPSTDLWMMGDRYGTVVSVRPYYRRSEYGWPVLCARVRLDKSGRTIRIPVINLEEI